MQRPALLVGGQRFDEDGLDDRPGARALGLKAATDNKVPVFAVDAAQADGIAANVTSDNADLGRKSALALLKAIGGSGDIAMFGHDPHPGVRARAAAARAEFDKAGVTVVTVKHVPVPGPVEGARKLTTDLIAVTPGLKGASGPPGTNRLWARHRPSSKQAAPGSRSSAPTGRASRRPRSRRPGRSTRR